MKFEVIKTNLRDVLILEPRCFVDERGFFYESFNENDFSKVIGKKITFVQDNHSLSKRGVLRGLHYQTQQTQGKLVRVVRGAVFDVVVDLRQASPTFGNWMGIELSADNKKQLWIPEGFAHGFLALSEEAEFLYKTTDYWHAESEQSILWNDPELNIEWPDIGLAPALNNKDAAGLNWPKAQKF
jgi:dTDP-4-dehydrorhamnose 3,5-epimerase